MNAITGPIVFLILFVAICAMLLEGLIYDAKKRKRDEK